MSLASGHQVENLGEEEMERQTGDFSGFGGGLVRLNPGRWLFPAGYVQMADKIYNFEFHSDDVVLVTFPKCGTTWASELLWLMVHSPDLAHPRTHDHILTRWPFLEFDGIAGAPRPPIMEQFAAVCPGRDPRDGVHLQLAECIPAPRTIKTHLPLSLLSPRLTNTAKVVAVLRNPKDVLVSYHHHCRLMKGIGFTGDLALFADYFIKGDCLWGAYWQHVAEVWAQRHNPNLHVIFYEDLQKDVLGELRKLDTFLGTGRTDAQLGKMAEHASFSSMKERGQADLVRFNQEVVKEGGGFFRKGVVGDWRDRLGPEVNARMDQWIDEHIRPLGVPFTFT